MSKPLEARTRELTTSQPPPSEISDEEIERLLELSRGLQRVRLAPGSEVPGTRYRIDGWLGDGGTGVVYEATHEDLGRKVAIKVLHARHSDDAQLLKTFLEEARIAIKLASPYLVEVIDFAELPDGRPLYVMERLRGVSLDREVEHAPMAAHRLIAILRQVCKGIAAAHDAGMAHRDIKPEHILVLDPREVAAHGRRDRVKIMDFGIAAAVGQGSDPQGTPSYAAPEQMLGIGVARQDDVYSLGCSAYELLVGKTPFRRGSVRDVMRAHLTERPQSVSAAIGNGVIHPALERVIMKCLERHRKDRYANMREVETALIEAQIAAGIETAWDDLPLPIVDPKRMEAMAEGLKALKAGQAATQTGYEWWIPAVLGMLIASVAALGGSTVLGRPVDTVEQGQPSVVDTLVSEAKSAAERAFYIYPPSDDPKAPTAFVKVRELETLKDPHEQRLGKTVAEELRREFADTLERLGDRYYARANGEPFAADFYIQALLFDPLREHLRERAMVGAGEFAVLKDKAESRTFGSGELEAADGVALVANLADPETKIRFRSWARKQREKRPLSWVADARIDAFMATEGIPAEEGHRDAEPGVAPTLPSVDALRDALEEALLEPSGLASDDAPGDGRIGNPRTARKLAAQGHDALRGGRWDDASRLFHAALTEDRTCSNALIGLSDLHFEKADHTSAVRYAKMAVAAAPRKATYRIKYGDALVKVLAYTEAGEQYRAAASLGSKVAEARLERLEEKIGV